MSGFFRCFPILGKYLPSGGNTSKLGYAACGGARGAIVSLVAASLVAASLIAATAAIAGRQAQDKAQCAGGNGLRGREAVPGGGLVGELDLVEAGDGIFNPMNLGVYSYAHSNPVKITDPDGKEAYGGSRDLGGFFVGVHAFIIIITDDPKKYGKHSNLFQGYTNKSGDIPGITKGGIFFAAVLSGDQTNNYPDKKMKGSNKLIKVPNQANDVNSLKELATGSQPLLRDSDLNLTDKLADGKGQSGLELDLSILNQFAGYGDQAGYTLIPSKGKDEYNSNSFARTNAEKGGAKNYPADLKGLDPGTTNVIPDKYFSQPVAP